MKVRISPAHGYVHGHIENLLQQIGVPVPARRPDGVVETEMSEAQISTFSLRGGAHRVERLAEGAAPIETPPPPPPPAEPAAAEPSLFNSLTCPACDKVSNIVTAVTPKGLFDFDCQHCGTQLKVENTGAGLEVRGVVKFNPRAISVPTIDEVIAAGYSPDVALGIVEKQKKLRAWVEAGNDPKTFVAPQPDEPKAETKASKK